MRPGRKLNRPYKPAVCLGDFKLHISPEASLDRHAALPSHCINAVAPPRSGRQSEHGIHGLNQLDSRNGQYAPAPTSTRAGSCGGTGRVAHCEL